MKLDSMEILVTEEKLAEVDTATPIILAQRNRLNQQTFNHSDTEISKETADPTKTSYKCSTKKRLKFNNYSDDFELNQDIADDEFVPSDLSDCEDDVSDELSLKPTNSESGVDSENAQTLSVMDCYFDRLMHLIPDMLNESSSSSSNDNNQAQDSSSHQNNEAITTQNMLNLENNMVTNTGKDMKQHRNLCSKLELLNSAIEYINDLRNILNIPPTGVNIPITPTKFEHLATTIMANKSEIPNTEIHSSPKDELRQSQMDSSKVVMMSTG